MPIKGDLEADDGAVGFLRFILSVEEERVIGASAHGPVVAPRARISEIPERDSIDQLTVFEEDPEQGDVGVGEFLFDLGRQAGDIGIKFGLQGKVLGDVRPHLTLVRKG